MRPTALTDEQREARAAERSPRSPRGTRPVRRVPLRAAPAVPPDKGVRSAGSAGSAGASSSTIAAAIVEPSDPRAGGATAVGVDDHAAIPSTCGSRAAPALEGARAAAAVAVFLFYEGHLRGGHLGIELFLTLAGFLATTSLLTAPRRGGRVDLAHFWSRRVRRLFPALAVLFVVAALYGAFVASVSELGRLRSEALGGLFLVSNWQAIFSDDGFRRLFAAPSALSHLWVLAILAQLYAAWSLTVYLVGPQGRRGVVRLFGIAVLLAGLSAVTMSARYGFGTDAGRAFLGTDTRGVGFFLGAAAACVGALWSRPTHPDRTRRARWRAASLAVNVLVITALAGIVWAWGHLSPTDPRTYEGGLAATAAAGTVVVGVAYHRGAGLVSWVFTRGPLRWLGRRTYGAYLWHLPVVVMLSPERTTVEGWPLTGLRAVVILVLATGSLHYVEAPFRYARLTPLEGRRLLLATTVSLVVALVLVTGRAGAGTSGGAEAVRVLVVGDHMAGDVADGLIAGDSSRLAVFDRSIEGCGIFSPSRTRVGDQVYAVMPECQRWAETWRGAIDEVQPDAVVLAVGEWDSTLQEIGGEWVDPCAPAYRSNHEPRLVEAFGLLSANGAPVVILTARGEETSGSSWAGCVNAAYRSFVATHHDRAVLADLGGFLCPGGPCPATIGGEPLAASNGIDLSRAAKEHLAHWLEPQVLRAAGVS